MSVTMNEPAKIQQAENPLARKQCIPCKGGVPPLKGAELEELQRQLEDGWEVVSGHHLEKLYRFPDFRSALEFTNRVGEMAEEQGHHPEIWLTWGKVKLTIWTHKIDGLTESDFIWAAKADELAAHAA
jgi:4a-hydroxytetrahydrobiopterin dehydratase